jgi:signal transduction histidine kinase
LNLLQNAVKFTFEGKIEVFLDYDDKTRYLTSQVKDSGIGISVQD